MQRIAVTASTSILWSLQCLIQTVSIHQRGLLALSGRRHVTPNHGRGAGKVLRYDYVSELLRPPCAPGHGRAITMRSSASLTYLAQETGLILVLSYLTLVGGGYVGLVSFETRVINHLLSAAIVFVWLGKKAWDKEGFPRTSLDLPIVGFVSALALATALSDIPRLSLEGLLWVLWYVMLFYMVTDLLRRGWPTDLFLKSLLVVGGVACLLAIVEALGWYLDWLMIAGLSEPLPPSSFRIVRTLGPNPLAAYINLLIPIAAIAAVGTRRRFNRLLLSGWLLLAFAVQFLTLSRGGWLGSFAMLVTLVSLVAYQYRSRLPAKRLRRRLRESKLLTATLVAAIVIGSVLVCLVGYRLLTIPSRRGSVQERVLMWRSGWMAFVENPVSGTGPWTYGIQFLRFSRVDLRRPVEKAHNIGLTILAESGVLGLGASLWLFGSVVAGLKKRWVTGNQNQRLLVGACLGMLAGALAHGLVEDFLSFPFFALTTVIVVALALGEEQAQEHASRLAISCRWLIGPVLVLLMTPLWTDIGYSYFSQGARLATEGDWEAAIPLVEKATGLDPAFPFYHYQLGFLYGNQTLSAESGNLDRAIEEYEIGVSQEPYYSLNHANLAALYWQDGQTEIAVEHARQAVELAPRAPEHAVQLGSYYEQLGSAASATALYSQAIDLDPSLNADVFWDASDLRQEFIGPYRRGALNASAPSSSGPGEVAYEEGRHEDAAAYFEEVVSRQPGNKTARMRLAKVYLALGDEEAAIRSLRIAIFLGAGREPHLELGRLAYQRGELAEAIAEFETALFPPVYSDFYGPGVYQREGIYQSRLPQLPSLGLTTDLLEDYLQLAEMYEEAQAGERARSIYLMLLEHLPQYQPALERLELVEHTPANH